MIDPANALNAYQQLDQTKTLLLVALMVIVVLLLIVWFTGRVRTEESKTKGTKAAAEANTETAVATVLTQLTRLLEQSHQTSDRFIMTLETVTSAHQTELAAREQSFGDLSAAQKAIGDTLNTLKNTTMASELVAEETAERLKAHTLAIEALKDTTTGLGVIAHEEHEKTRRVTTDTMHGELVPLMEQLRTFETVLRAALEGMNTTAYEHVLDNILTKVTAIELRLYEILKPPVAAVPPQNGDKE